MPEDSSTEGETRDRVDSISRRMAESREENLTRCGRKRRRSLKK
jgi:hypothetical protein